jgi:hypothetical protein
VPLDTRRWRHKLRLQTVPAGFGCPNPGGDLAAREEDGGPFERLPCRYPAIRPTSRRQTHAGTRSETSDCSMQAPAGTARTKMMRDLHGPEPDCSSLGRALADRGGSATESVPDEGAVSLTRRRCGRRKRPRPECGLGRCLSAPSSRGLRAEALAGPRTEGVPAETATR